MKFDVKFSGRDSGFHVNIQTVGQVEERAKCHILSFAMKPNSAFAIFLGKEGVGKTAIFNKIADAVLSTDGSFCCSASIGVSHSWECDLQIIDPVRSSLPCALTWMPLNGLFVLVEFHPRIGSTMIDSFWETFSVLKYDCLDMVTVLVTKMDLFEPGGIWPSIVRVVEDICKVLKEDVGVERVIFSYPEMKKEDLAKAICEQVKDLPLRQLEYTDAELIQYFGINESEGQQKKSRIKTALDGEHHAIVHKLCTGDNSPNASQGKSQSISLCESEGLLLTDPAEVVRDSVCASYVADGNSPDLVGATGRSFSRKRSYLGHILCSCLSRYWE
jgi:hypothetical protein